jgi:integrase
MKTTSDSSDRPKKQEKPLSADTAVKSAQPGEHTVTGAIGLILRVHAAKDGSLTRSWIVRVSVNGQRRRLGLGQYPDVALAAARQKAADARRAVSEGVDPSISARRQERAAEAARSLTLGAVIDGYLATAAPTFKNSKSDVIRTRALRHHFAPLHARDVTTVTPADIADILRTLKPETASRAYTCIRGTFDYVEARLRPLGVVIHNPAAPRPLAALGWRRKSRTTHAPHPSIPWRLVPEVVAAIGELDGVDVRCLLFVIATATRSGSARLAKWRDINLEARTWSIPRADLKAGPNGFVVPLNDLAIGVLRSMPRTALFVFPDSSGNPITDQYLLHLMRRLRRKHDDWRDPHGEKKPFTIHGFRASLKTWTREAPLKRKIAAHIPTREIAELVLGHKIGDEVERAYDRSDLFDARREIMDLWARHCLGAKIIAFPNARA